MERFKYKKYDYTNIGICDIKSLKSALTIDLYTTEREMTAILSQQIARQIDREIIEYLRENNLIVK